MFKLVYKSLFKQGIRPVLIIVQFSIGFCCIAVALGLIEGTNQYVSQVKNMIPEEKTIRLNILTSNVDENKLNHLYEYLQSHEGIETGGTFLRRQYDLNRLQNIPMDSFQNKDPIHMIFVDQGFLDLLDIQVAKGLNSRKGIFTKNKHSIPVLIGYELSDGLKIGDTFQGEVFNERTLKFVPKTYRVAGILSKGVTVWKGGTSSLDGAVLSGERIIIAPMQPEHNMDKYLLNRLSFNSFFVVEKSINVDAVVEDIEQKLSSLDLEGSVPTIQEQIQDIKELNKPLIYFTLGFSTLLFILSLFGIIGVVLASVERRFKEFGIMYAVGATRSRIYWLIFGEVFLSLMISGMLGISGVLLFSSLNSTTMLELSFMSVFKIIGIVVCVVTIAVCIPILKLNQHQPVDLLRKG